MTFRVIVPQIVTAAQIAATNIADEPAYQSGASYTFEASFVLGADGNVYQFIGNTGTTHAAPTATGQTDWVLIGPPNKLRPFDVQKGIDQDSVIGTQAERADTITYQLTGLGRIMGIAFMNVDALAIETRVSDASPGDVLDQIHVMPDLALVAGSFWNYFYLPRVQDDEHILADLNVPPGATIDITIDNTGNVARVGAIVLGLAMDLGGARVNASWSLSSYSIQKFDGYKRTLRRLLPGEGVDIEVIVAKGGERRLQRVLADLEGVAAVFIPSIHRPEFTVYGVHRGLRMTGEDTQNTFLSIRIEGI